MRKLDILFILSAIMMAFYKLRLWAACIGTLTEAYSMEGTIHQIFKAYDQAQQY